MSKYPVPIFQPTIPLDGQVSSLWLEQLSSWMTLQLERNEEVRRQLETQNHLLLQLNRRLDRVFLKLAMLEPNPAGNESGAMVQGNAGQSSGAPNTHPQTESFGSLPTTGDNLDSWDENSLNDRQWSKPPTTDRHSPVSSWKQQRESMLKCLVAQLEIEDSLYPAENPAPNARAESASVGGLATPSMMETNPKQLSEIDSLKEQLQAAIREMEVECSVQRAKLSHEKAQLEAREADLSRREKKLARDNREQVVAEERAEPLVSRIKGIIRKPGS